jgi:hypothetical protein
MSNQTEISISQDLVKDLVNVLLKFDSVKSREIAAELNKKLGGWKPLSDLRGRISTGRDVAEIYELLSLDGKTGALAVSAGIPSRSPVDMLVVISTRDGIPILVDQEEFSGWRPYVFPEDPV